MTDREHIHSQAWAVYMLVSLLITSACIHGARFLWGEQTAIPAFLFACCVGAFCSARARDWYEERYTKRYIQELARLNSEDR